MKLRKLFWMGILLIPLLACEDVNESTETSAELDVPIPLEAVMIESAASPMDLYSFDGSAAFCLGNKDNVKDCPGMIMGVVPGSGAKLHFDGIGEFEEIHSLALEWGYGKFGSTEFEMQPSVDLLKDGEVLTSSNITIDIDEVLVPVIQEMDSNPRIFVFIRLSGWSNFDVSFDARMKVPIVVESEELSPRFTL
ncbi:hypothetical protein [Maribellus mangrovi]|uniref:hypothetical protein n=1 Tax=Maribellus mangrovi TaxID=3133146 RepID=UPI0030EB4329